MAAKQPIISISQNPRRRKGCNPKKHKKTQEHPRRIAKIPSCWRGKRQKMQFSLTLIFLTGMDNAIDCSVCWLMNFPLANLSCPMYNIAMPDRRERHAAPPLQRDAGWCKAWGKMRCFRSRMGAGDESAGCAPYSAKSGPRGQTGWHREHFVPDQTGKEGSYFFPARTEGGSSHAGHQFSPQ